ncbi:hypothetical protein [Pseudoalteromonas sp.]|uniref:hypothetical protein n=1 Tax=Pseudoalteromonas sp. TaxID=53249 RepID=UPI00356AD21D
MNYINDHFRFRANKKDVLKELDQNHNVDARRKIDSLAEVKKLAAELNITFAEAREILSDKK